MTDTKISVSEVAWKLSWKRENLKLGKQSESRTAIFYLLLEIHKVKVPGQFPTGRHIINANICPTERIPVFVYENINEAVPKLKSYIKN